ncbi:RNA polymerase-associated protein LEO1 [Sporothrix brasiliensis 5110]|uniref:RNA polymerase-associated protein LEO1 n=1 Tax=Sporothrix brasiliensis 5110 TaxID=1398154 RepID=A0A0C2J0L8_9PEZI|nr:RNA polymerase-associated protein LEO1 [Sporothrix brasiliensis 5110]KIH94931.1 RNA polymerase-associated protein LEO1 [Sporothrix brasiliensis 5110]
MSDSEGHIESPAAAADSPVASPPADSPIADDDDAIASGDDLFGGGDDDDEGQLSDQPLSEHGLDSDDDRDEDGERYGEDGGRSARQQQRQTREETEMDVDMYRHRTPKSTDGNLQSLRIPPFIKMNPEEYRPDTFVPTDFDLENSLAKNPHSVVRFRRDPETGAVQSNTAIYRWSDGSVTLAVGDEHFEVLTKGLADPEHLTEKGGYQELQDAHYYAAAAHLSSSLLLTVGHVTAQYSVRANHTVADDALKRLTDRLQAATQSPDHTANMIIRTVRDPELAKKEAELAEKERERAKRRRETAAARLDGSASVGGRSGWGGGALSVGDLEGGGRRGGGRRKGGSGGAGARAKRRRDEYDSDDELPQGARRNDEYDKGDDFIAPSDDDVSDEEGGEDDDEEEEEEELDDDDDDDEDDRRGGSSHRAKRQKTAEAEDDDAEGDDDLPAARRNRRNIIDDDDDE